ncbi:MAG: hypothetical protein KUL82_10790 [Bdellovibrio sp.]|nr:hypothetical protein [Bdellovibrio sp.]
MKKWIRLTLFLLAFQMEVRVRASGDLIEQPSSCLKSKEACAIQVTGNAFHLIQDSVKIHAPANTALMRLNSQQWRLIKGTLWVEKGSQISLETLYGDLTATQGQYWVVDQGNRILVRNMNANLVVTLRDGKTLNVPEGFEFWMSGLNSQGKSEFGMIQPIDMKEHLPLWNSLYGGSKESFIKEVVHLRENWGDLAEKSSVIYQGLVERKIASEAEKKKQLEEKKARQAAELRQMRELYRQRVFER